MNAAAMTPLPPRRIVLTGGSGFVGRATARCLLRHWPGLHLRVPTRDAARAARALAGLPRSDGAEGGVEIVAADVLQVSALGVSASAPSHYLRSKAAGELVWRSLATSGTGGVDLLRPSVIFGADDRFTTLFARLLRWSPALILTGARARFQPVWVEDLAVAVRTLLEHPPAVGTVRLHDAAGPEVLTLADIVRSVGRLANTRRPVIAAPEGVGRLQAALLALPPGEPLMSADNLLSMRVANVAGPGAGLRELGVAPAGLEIAAAWLSSRNQGRRATHPKDT